jgi:non-heme Fe2+,alpha-ketoglutarate-dependent halogenase
MRPHPNKLESDKLECEPLQMAMLNLKPEGRICRFYSVFGLIWLQIHKFLNVPMWLMPIRRLRQVNKLWTEEMQKEYIRSIATKLPHDEPCTIATHIEHQPINYYKRKVNVETQYQLSETEIQKFYENGFLKPFNVFEPQEIQELGEQLLERRQDINSIYGFVNDRDRHLEVPEMLQAMKHPAIVERLAQLLGSDLISWRSQIFYKPPGGETTGWHQASTYLFEMGFTDPTIIPPKLDELFMLTVWIPCDPVTLENGCLQFVKGSLLGGIKYMRLGGDIGFHEVNYYPDYEVDPDDVLSVEMDLGQVLIFSERAIHGSPPNKSNRNRFAFNYRVVPTNVKVYPDAKHKKQHRDLHKSAQMNESYDLAKWNAILLRGKANDLNRIKG